MIKLKYGNTNTFFLPGSQGGLLIDTDYAGTLPALSRELKRQGLRLRDIAWVLATHYHPDHMGLVGALMAQGVRLLLLDTQAPFVHFSDPIFARDRLPFTPVDAARATVISCGESRAFLRGLGISGQIVSTPSHSADSVSLVLDSGDAFVGDLEPYEYLEAYGGNAALQRDWDLLLSLRPRRIFFAHMPERNVASGAD